MDTLAALGLLLVTVVVCYCIAASRYRRRPVAGGRVRRWWRRRRFLTAYRIVRNEAERHKAAGHDVQFAAVNEAYMVIDCNKCPNLSP